MVDSMRDADMDRVLLDEIANMQYALVYTVLRAAQAEAVYTRGWPEATPS